MKKTWKNFWTDAVMFVQILALSATGIILKWVLPPGSGHGLGHGHGHGHELNDGTGPETLLGLGRHDWGDVHFWIAVSLVAILVLHVILHWTWVKCRIYELFGREKGEVCDTGAD